MREFKGKAGTIYIEQADSIDGTPFEVWFEDFCILGRGNSELAALQEAARHADDLRILITDAIGTPSTTAVGAGGD